MRSTPLNGRYALAGDPREGGAALVYKAADLESDLRHVAVKIFSEQADSRLAPKFFANECQALQELRHAGIIEMLDWGTIKETGQRFLVLEWMDGTLFRTTVERVRGLGLVLRRDRAASPRGACLRARPGDIGIAT